MQIDCEFPGGNIIVDGIEGDTARIRHDNRDTEGFWFYWSFRVRGAAGRTVRFAFTDEKNVLGTRGPCVSADGGTSWQWLGSESVKDHGFAYAFAQDAHEVYFAVGIPYLESNLKTFLARHEGNPALRTETLCRSEGGREIELLRVGRHDGGERYRVAFTCRHHCCEAMASYALEGILEAALAADDLGAWYRGKVAIAAVPFMDKDGVEAGDQGKNRRPYDHNRDYAPPPDGGRYASCNAVKAFLETWSQGRIDFAMDLHCPYLKGGDSNEQLYFVGGPSQENWARVLKLAAILEEHKQGPLPYSAKHSLPYGKLWNTYDGPLRSFGRWANEQSWMATATSIEVPYANCGEVTTRPENVRTFGRDFARALQTFLTSTT